MNVVVRLPIFKENVCRLCATNIESNSKLFPIFGSGVNEIGISIKEILPALDIKLDDLKPQQICLDCLDKLNVCRKFLHCCIESDFKFNSYIQQCQVDEEDAILKSSMATAYSLGQCEWENDLEKEPLQNEIQPSEGVIVLSNMGTAMQDNSGQDYVVMVELKYKDELRPLSGLSHIGSKGILESHPYQDVTGLVSSRESPEEKGSVVIPESAVGCSKDIKSCSESNNNLTQTKSGVSDSSSNDSSKLDYKTSSHNATNGSKQEHSRVFECPVCERQFKRRTRLTSHMTLHSENKPHSCPGCGKKFGTQMALRVHQRKHTKEYECSVCRKTFSSNDKLGRHRRTHTGERPFECATCGKAFAEKRNLENHTRTHTGERPYRCPVCDRTFSVRTHAVQHVKVHHSTEPYQCPHCTKKFKWKNTYKRHIKQNHPERH